MREDIKVRWVEALRSGQYEQTEGLLANDNGFCCLGVLCEIAVQDGVVAKQVKDQYEGDPNDDHVVTYGVGSDFHYEMDAVLPSMVYEWAELETSNPSILWEGVTHPISDLNDDYHLNFSQIADVIEEQY